MFRLKYLILVSVVAMMIISNNFNMATCYAAENRLKIVATQTMFADIVKEIGKDKVDVKYVAPPKFNVHFIHPKPTDVRNIMKADLYVNAGLDLEAWSDPLLEAAGKPGLFRGRERNVDMSKGVRLLDVPDHRLSRAEGDIHLFGNPHYNMNPENVKVMSENVFEKLKRVDPLNTEYYEANEKNFISHLDAKISEWRKLCSHCKGQEILSYHKDIAYFADFLGLVDEEYIETKPGIPPTPKHLAFLEGYVKEHNIKAIVMPTYYPKGAADKLAKRVGARIVTICQNVGEIPEADNIFSFFDYNFKQISEALK